MDDSTPNIAPRRDYNIPTPRSNFTKLFTLNTE